VVDDECIFRTRVQPYDVGTKICKFAKSNLRAKSLVACVLY
jgi:hypothetical protein